MLYLVIALGFALLVAIFAVQNTELVAINFLAWKFREISLVLVILGSSIVGAVFMFLLGMVKQLSLYRKQRELQAENKRLSDEIIRLEKEVSSVNSVEEPDVELNDTVDIDN